MAKTFPKKELQALLWGEETTLKEIKDQIYETSRWSIHHELVFKDTTDGKLYSVSYSRGATEQQDESPFEYEPNDVEVTEVRAVEKTIIVYEAV